MKKKSLIMLLCAVLLVGTVAMGTIAFLTDSKSITNVFTVGNISIGLDEAKVNEQGQPLDANGNVVNEREQAERTEDSTTPEVPEGNKYHMIPGREYTKDPTVTVQANSEESYIRMLVTITDIDAVKANVKAATEKDFMPGDHVAGYDAEKWRYIGETEVTDGTSKAAVYEFRYHETVSTMPTAEAAAQARQLEPLFTHFTVPTELNVDQLAAIADMQIIVTAQAIQAATFTPSADGTETAEDAAWKAFDVQNTTVTNP